MKVLALDPSGNFYEGKGTTGWAFYFNDILTSVGQIRAEQEVSQMTYWQEHLRLLEALTPDVVVIELYKLYASASNSQVGSQFETPQLIGVLKMYCATHNINVILQPATIKERFTNEILLKNNVITQDVQKRYYAKGVPISNHILDAIRHGEYYLRYKKKG